MNYPLLLSLCLCVGLGAGAAPRMSAQAAVDRLDADGNGLYDDTERKALLDILSQASPELAGPYDKDGDGKVTILEMSEGRHPLSKLLPRSFVETGPKIPWALDLFPEWLASAYFQEDVAVGEDLKHTPRGLFVRQIAAQEEAALRPAKRAEKGGVEFAADSGQFLTMPGHRNALWDYRWCIFTFRIDAKSGSSDEMVLVDINSGSGPHRSTPKITFSKRGGLSIQYVGRNAGGLDRRVMTAKNIVADGKSWNVVVCGIRHGQMYAEVNGVPLVSESKQPERFSSTLAHNATSYLGDRENAGNMAWAYDSLVFGLTEPTETMVRKMTGWAAHRLGFADRLPSGHAYASARPVLDVEDLPRRFLLDEEQWLAWGASLNRRTTRANAGGARVEPKGFSRVFYDDFRANRVKPSTSGEGDLWFAPGFNTATGYEVQLAQPGESPDAYPYDAKEKIQTLSLVKRGDTWRASGFYSVNDMGYGYTWKGPKIFRVRSKFPYIPKSELPGGLFPCFWSYDPQFLFWRTANRIELDWFELDSGHGHWLNGLSSHFHFAQVKNPFAKNDQTYKRFKIYGGDLTEERGNIPGGIYIWDGQWRTWEWVVDEDMIYCNITITDQAGRERWVEIFRAPVSQPYFEPLDLQLVYAARPRRGMPNADRVDWHVDWVEVLQKTSIFDEVPAPFIAKPRLTGSVRAGATITCEPNVGGGITDLRYYWFADGYPLTFGASPTYTLTAAEVGKEIRCMVKAVGALDSPDAWSNPLR